MAPSPRILIVEDDEIIANLIGIMLEKRGYNIVGKTGYGEQAIIRASELEPDLILMDISLAGTMDGVTAACYLFQLFHCAIVFLTAHCDDQLLERAKNAQPLGFILKPFTDRDLGSNVELALYNHRIRKKHLELSPVGDVRKIMGALESYIILDDRGTVVFYNPYALRFLDLPAEEVLTHHWRDLMMIMSDQTGQEIEDPVPEVAKQMLVVSLEFNTSVVTRDGRSRMVSIILRPVKDDRNGLIGVFMHIREKTPGEIKMATRV